jgi:hypothetical protein
MNTVTNAAAVLRARSQEYARSVRVVRPVWTPPAADGLAAHADRYARMVRAMERAAARPPYAPN